MSIIHLPQDNYQRFCMSVWDVSLVEVIVTLRLFPYGSMRAHQPLVQKRAFRTETLRYEHCYSDESLMGEIGAIASRTHASTMEWSTMNRYRALLDCFLGPDMILTAD